jgi:uncharacterized integral membrane protein
MGDLWLKIKIWTKAILFGLITLYVLFFFVNNSGQNVRLWFFFRREYDVPVLLLVFLTFVIGVIGTLLVRTTLKTVRQIRDVRVRERAVRLEREVADMKAKAAMLQTRTESGGSASNAPLNPEP